MARPSETKRLDNPTNAFEMDALASNCPAGDSPRSNDIDETTIRVVRQNASASELEIRRVVLETSLRSTRNAHEVTGDIGCLHMATDVVLMICAIIIAISLFGSLGIFIFGQYRISRGLGHFVLAFEGK